MALRLATRSAYCREAKRKPGSTTTAPREEAVSLPPAAAAASGGRARGCRLLLPLVHRGTAAEVVGRTRGGASTRAALAMRGRQQ